MIPERPHRKKRPKNPHKPKRNFKDFLKFTAVAVIIMIGFDYVAFDGERPYITKMKQDYYAKQRAQEDALEQALPPEVEFSEEELAQISNDELEPDLLHEKYLNIMKLSPQEEVVQVLPNVEAIPNSQKRRVYKNTKKPKIAIVIDDIGMNMRQSRAAINLPAQMTLAMLPYAPKVRELARQAKGKGHELIIHTPMEALAGNDASLGSMALKTNMPPNVFKAEFNKIANSFEGYVGVNNHMGSRLTQDRAAMGILMHELSKRGLFFLDSKTISTSVASDVAKEYLIPHATRDVFLDHEDTPEYVAQAIAKIEHIAGKTGSVIAIGHPKEITMNALEQWIPDAQARGFEFVPLSQLMKHPDSQHLKVKNANIEQVDEEKKVIVVNVEPTTPRPQKTRLPKVT